MDILLPSLPISTQIRAVLKEAIVDRGQPAALIHQPLLVAIEKTTITGDDLLAFCRLRYHAVSQFEALLEFVYQCAVKNNRPNLTKVLHRNLCDERGLAYEPDAETGQVIPSGYGAHNEWRQDFLDALGIAAPDGKPYLLYRFDEQDDFSQLIGMLLAAEFMVPFEDQRVLNALKKCFPEVMESPKASRYLHDHVEHDFSVHFPELMEAVVADIRDENELAKVEEGIRRVVAERYRFYEYSAERISL